MLRLFQAIMQGPKGADLPERHDLTWREGLALVPLVVGLVLLGINPHAVAAFALDTANAALVQPANGVNVVARNR
jgi:NADH:ubiquinone oxidoreductase subunit 4 (subunit M)